MEKFMFLFRGGQNHAENAADSPEARANMQSWMTWMDDLAKKGILVGGEPLQRTGKQVNGKNKVVTDGPFIEAKETVGGYLIVQVMLVVTAIEADQSPVLIAEGEVTRRLFEGRQRHIEIAVTPAVHFVI